MAVKETRQEIAVTLTGTIYAAQAALDSAGQVINVEEYERVYLSFKGTDTAVFTLLVEGIPDSTDPATFALLRTEVVAGDTPLTELWKLPALASYQAIRVKVSAYTSGKATVYVNAIGRR